jgi:uncharacterized C2H2 Zn-finger protein
MSMVLIKLDKKDPNNLNESKSRRKRRSKNEQDGRLFKCPDCGKSYLSQPALTNHKKSKHKYNIEGEKKGRGRPRKNVITICVISFF